MKNLPRKAVLSCGVAIGALAIASGAFAQQRAFDIPAQPATKAVPEFARQAGIQIISSGSDLRGLQAAPVKGEHDVRTALALMLAGTGLTVDFDDGSTIVLRKAAQDPQGSSAAGAGAEVEALIVTAQKREEDIQDVPIAISAFTQEDLERSQVATGADLMTQVPNMTFTKTNFSSYSIQLRGIGTQAISVAVDPAVAVAFNNTPFLRAHFFEQEFYDLARVEVLRGPQGTLYGRNATAGVVNIISAKPKFDFEAKLSADIANYNSTRVEGMINLPLVEDQVALRLAGAWTKRDGYAFNEITGRPIDGRNLWSTRASLRFDPNERLSANLIWEHFEEDDDRLRSGKQTCKRATTPDTIMGVDTLPRPGDSGHQTPKRSLNQGCLPTSFWSPEAFEVPDGRTLPYYLALSQLNAPIQYFGFATFDIYARGVQSRDLRTIESQRDPTYRASADTLELNIDYDLSDGLTLSSQTGFNIDSVWSHQDFNRFNTREGAFVYCDPITGAGGESCQMNGNNNDLHQLIPDPVGGRYNSEAGPELMGQPCDIEVDFHCDIAGIFCDPQIGCSNRLVLEDLVAARSRQFVQELRLASSYDGAFNFSIGANYMRYKTLEKYYVFVNTLTLVMRSDNKSGTYSAVSPWIPGVSDNSDCLRQGFTYTDPTTTHNPQTNTCGYIDPNPIMDLNDEGHNYFLSTNPYKLTSYAVFGEAYYDIAENLKLTAGLRWTVDQKHFVEIPSQLFVSGYGYPVTGEIDQEWREPTGRLVVDWQPDLSFTDETLVYGSYVRGYKAGGANPPGAVLLTHGPNDVPFPTHPKTFDAEFVDAFELGAKNTLLDGRLTLNLATFYYDYKDYQISQIVDRSAVNLNFDAEVFGVEAEADWRPLENLRLGLKIGYEDTRVADGMRAIDLMDRTAGNPDWMVIKPYVTQASNCILPTYVVAAILKQTQEGRAEFDQSCGAAYNEAVNPLTGYSQIDPVTYLPYVPDPTTTFGGIPVAFAGYPGFDPLTAPNGGAGFEKDLSGNELPNAPRWTGTLTVDYTVPLPGDWLATLHADLYQQSEAWTRIYNMPGYDKLKAINNVNLAAIFSNEDAGWMVMAYVKNVFDKDNITGAFLNSDDTALTTNVFLNEPRLYGLRVTKSWSHSPWWTAPYRAGAHNPFTLELEGYHGPTSEDHELVTLLNGDLFSDELPVPLHVQDDLSWGSAGGAKLSYQPNAGGWRLSGAVRYGRAAASTKDYQKQALPEVCMQFYGKYFCKDVTAGTASINGVVIGTSEDKVYNYTETRVANEEDHTVADFIVGKDVGIGGLGGVKSSVGFGVRYANLGSSSEVVLHGRPDYTVPANWLFGLTRGYRLQTESEISREFTGVGPVLTWDASIALLDRGDDGGRLDLEVGVGGGVLFGDQKAKVEVEQLSRNVGLNNGNGAHFDITPPVEGTISRDESKSATAPTVGANIGLSYTLGGFKVSGGYRAERYFDVIDGGIAERQTFDRDINGAYVRLSLNFGG